MNRKPIEIKSDSHSNIYFGSDFHLNHNPQGWSIAEKRGFKDIQEHDSWILGQLASLKPTDLLVFLGDFSLNSSTERTLEMLQSIPCPTLYINGNHESYVKNIYNERLNDYLRSKNIGVSHRSFYVYPFAIEGYPGLGPTVSFLGEDAFIRIDRKTVYLKHMAAMIWDKMKFEYIHLMGHSHSSLPGVQPNDTEGLRLDVGLENAKNYNNSCFFSWREIQHIMLNKKYVKLDHH